MNEEIKNLLRTYQHGLNEANIDHVRVFTQPTLL
jgi:hypothetical protein